MPQHRRYSTDAERQRAYRERRAQAEQSEWDDLQGVMREAALLCQAEGMPYETPAQVAESLRQLRGRVS